MIAKIIAFLLRKNLSVSDRVVLVNAVINRLEIPTRAIITVDDNRRIVVQGKPLSTEQTQSLQESAFALANNPALKLIRDQVRFQAVDLGYLQNVDSDKYRELFYKAALWYAQEETALIASLAGTKDPTL